MRLWRRASLGHVGAVYYSEAHGTGATESGVERDSACCATQVLVNDDSRSEAAAWLAVLTGPNDFLVSSPNVHEIRAYNRLARMARGEYLLLLQGDHCLPQGREWLQTGLGLFATFPRLALLGGQMGFDEVPLRKRAERVSWGVPPCRPIPTRVPRNGMAHRDAVGAGFMFVAGAQRHTRAFTDPAHGRTRVVVYSVGVNIGPLLVRRSAFLLAGGFDEGFSCAGEPGAA